MTTADLLEKSRDGEVLAGQDLIALLDLPPASAEAAAVIGAGGELARALTDNRAESHAQFAINLAPCGKGCKFCSFASINRVFTESSELSVEEAVKAALQFERDEANAVFIMATANYDFGKYLEVGTEIRRQLREDTLLIANIGDRTLGEAQQLKDAGFAGVYHALRLREGTDTNLDPEQRRLSMRNFREAGLGLGTCVEPVGPEHTNEEIAALIEFTASINPSYSGAARRISIPGTELARHGMISELRMAQIVAVTRLGMPRTTIGNCTHEPCTLGALAGANLFWAETGANPRDVLAKTEEGRGHSIADCRALFEEAGWQAHNGPSRYYA